MNPTTFLVLLAGTLFVALIFALDSGSQWKERAKQFEVALKRLRY